MPEGVVVADVVVLAVELREVVGVDVVVSSSAGVDVGVVVTNQRRNALIARPVAEAVPAVAAGSDRVDLKGSMSERPLGPERATFSEVAGRASCVVSQGESSSKSWWSSRSCELPGPTTLKRSMTEGPSGPERGTFPEVVG